MQDFPLLKITVNDVMLKMQNEEFAFGKLLHGYWERIAEVCKERDVEGIKNDLRKICEEKSATELLDVPPLESEFYLLSNSKFFIDYHWIEILEQLNSPHAIWGVHWNGYPSDEICHNKSLDVMHILLRNQDFYDGLMWKQSAIDGTLIKFLKFLEQYEVVIVGLKHLENAKIVNSNHFFPVQMPLAPRRFEFLQELREYHKQFSGKKVVYLLQLAMTAPWLCGKYSPVDFPNGIFLDWGRVLDIWADVRPHQPWIEKIPFSLMNFYRGKSVMI